MTSLQKTRLMSLLERMTISGKAELEADQVRELKQICRQSDDYVWHAHAFVMKQLKTKHAEVRLSSLQVICMLFEKSGHFRELLFGDFQGFLELVTGFSLLNIQRKLPPPENVAERLRTLALDAVKTWTKRFGEAYPRLEVASRFLETQEALGRKRQHDSSDFPGSNNGESSAVSRRRQTRANALARNAQRARDEFEEKRGEIDECVRELGSTIELLVPTLDDFAQTGLVTNAVSLVVPHAARQNPPLSGDSEIVIEINPRALRIRRTEDNAAVLEALSERLKQVDQALLPELRRWLNTFQKSEGFDETVKDCIDYKNTLTDMQNKALILGVETKSRSTTIVDPDDDEGDDDEFLDVADSSVANWTITRAPPGTIDRLLYETEFGGIHSSSSVPGAADDPVATFSLGDGLSHEPVRLCKNINDILHPSPKITDTSTGSDKATPPQPSKLSTSVPVVSFGHDLKYWGRENCLTMPERVAPLDAVWSMQSGEKGETAELTAAARTRTYAFKSEWKPVEHTCRVPIKNGKLCPRQDRIKCPLHGLIIPRDAVGKPVDAKQAENLTSSQRKGVLGHLLKSNASTATDKPWQDVSLLHDIEAQTGRSMGAATMLSSARKRSDRRCKFKRPKQSNLTDIKAVKNTVEKRLEKKLFHTATVKRVGERIDREVRTHSDDKFRHQWNYAT